MQQLSLLGDEAPEAPAARPERRTPISHAYTKQQVYDATLAYNTGILYAQRPRTISEADYARAVTGGGLYFDCYLSGVALLTQADIVIDRPVMHSYGLGTTIELGNNERKYATVYLRRKEGL